MSNPIYKDDKDRILNNIKIDTGTSCWEWQLGKYPNGYGQTKFNGRGMGAHRLSFMLLSNPMGISTIPHEMCVLHSCDNPGCVNPTHLWLGSKQDNMTDKINKGRNRCPIGEDHGMSKLKEFDVMRICEMLDDGYTQSYIASRFPVSCEMISRIKMGKAWTHLTGRTHEQQKERFRRVKN